MTDLLTMLSFEDAPRKRNDLLEPEQIKLAQLSVYNWGSFHGLHTAAIDPEGTLITGDNGAGKSTLVDGLMALLLPAGKATFNMAAAQGDRSDRSLLSYMRGSFGSAHDGSSTRVKSKREKGVVTGLRACYKSDDGVCITLAALFWTTQSSNALSDVKRIYLIAKRDVSLKELLDAFSDGNARQLKQYLRDDPAITCCDDSFSDYQILYRKYLYMDNKNAPALLSRALGLKKIDDLTKLIRELVLEPSGVKHDARKVVDEFADLVAIHDQLADAKEQSTHLNRLPELADTIESARQDLQVLSLEKQQLAVYFAEAFVLLWREKLNAIDSEIESVVRQIKHHEIEEQDAREAIERRHEAYLNLGGDKIESVRKALAYVGDKLKDVVRASSSYQADCTQLGLAGELNAQTFAQNQQTADARIEQIRDNTKQSQDAFGETAAQLSEHQKKLSHIQEEIQEIQSRPDSNIDVKYQQLRDEMIASLSLPADELAYVGELIDVKEEERSWQGAIERALGGLRTTLLVPQKNYTMVTRWLNVRHTGVHVRVQVVRLERNDKAPPEFKEQGYLKKLVWKTHRYRDWLKWHLHKFDLACVAGTDALDVTPFSMTKEGLVHMESGRFEKKDQHRVDDRRKWSLGFSNKSRLTLLNADQKQIEQKLVEFEKALEDARGQLNRIAEETHRWERLRAYAWDSINAPYWQARFETTQTELSQLESSAGNLNQAKLRWEQSKEKLSEIQQNKNQCLVLRGSLEKDQKNAQEEVQRNSIIATEGLSDQVKSRLTKRVGVVTLNQPDKQSQVERMLDVELEKARSKKNTAENSANGIMGSFRGKDKWQPITVDWAVGLEGLQDYLAHYQYLKTEGLPELVNQFKQRLNKHATQSLARIKTKLESEKEDILERIQIINQVLRRTEFKQGSHLKLGSKKEKYAHVVEFERKLTQALSQVTSDDHEARFVLLTEVVESLNKASTPASATSLESLRLLDPRYQMSFFAEEIDSETLDVRDVLESSSGKSGGGKESFAGTIVAASLAYVLTPDGYEKPIYSTVFLDEAFSNTAEAVSRRVLKVFKALHIHVNLITPYKNLNLARETARSLLIAERDAVRHESQLCEVTWEEIDRQTEALKAARLRSDTQSLGLELHDPV